MTRLNCLLCISIVLVPHIALLAVEKDGKTEAATTKPSHTASPRPGLHGQYALIAAQAQLNDKQINELMAIATEEREVQTRMQAVNQEKIARLRKDLADARKANNVDSISTILQQIMRINATESKARKAFEARAMEIMEPQQRAKWAGFGLCKSLCGALLRAKLTDDQKKAVRGLCDDTALELGDDGLKTTLQRSAAQRKLRDKVKAEILTGDQRKALGGRPTKSAAKARTAKPTERAKPPRKPARQPRARRS